MKSISLEAAVDQEYSVRCDPQLISQALINLLDNAIKYTEDGGRVQIRIRELGDRPEGEAAASRSVKSISTYRPAPSGQLLLNLGEPPEIPVRRIALEVTDSGIGIPSDSLPRVFERFYRVDKGRSRAMGGTGLGLSIVRHLVHAHGEDVFVESELGRGSTFGFTLALVHG
jgi:two-component system phosphate regulon sensor histidine kinase PhoR